MTELHRAAASFGNWMEREYRTDALYDSIQTLSGPEAGGADLAIRLRVGRSYYEAKVDLENGQLQVGFATESRVINESIEQMILDNGGDLSDLLADELSDLGEEPLPMEHFYERPAFRYVVRISLGDPDELESPGLRCRVGAVLKAGRVLFQDCVDDAVGVKEPR